MKDINITVLQNEYKEIKKTINLFGDKLSCESINKLFDRLLEINNILFIEYINIKMTKFGQINLEGEE